MVTCYNELLLLRGALSALLGLQMYLLQVDVLASLQIYLQVTFFLLRMLLSAVAAAVAVAVAAAAPTAAAAQWPKEARLRRPWL
jgi:hypothetical protein